VERVYLRQSCSHTQLAVDKTILKPHVTAPMGTQYLYVAPMGTQYLYVAPMGTQYLYTQYLYVAPMGTQYLYTQYLYVAPMGTQYLYVAFSCHNKIPRCSAYDIG